MSFNVIKECDSAPSHLSLLRCIEGVSGIVQPILDVICAYTGMKATLLVGGPEPADGGRINVIRYVPGPISLKKNLTHFLVSILALFRALSPQISEKQSAQHTSNLWFPPSLLS